MAMKTFLVPALLLLAVAVSAQSSNGKYSKALADSLGADEYGMKTYILVILKTGTATGISKPVSDSLFGEHLKNIGRLAAIGKLVVAGPLRKNEKAYRGIFILNVKSLEEAAELFKTDAAIQAKLLDTESYYWYGSGALPMYLPYHDKIQKTQM
jgi:uncharacterized protein YciI